MRPLDLVGKKFNRLTVVSKAEKRRNLSYWHCVCDCGTKTVVHGSSLKNGTTKSCGCLLSEVKTTHGMSRSSAYRLWWALVGRCTNPNNTGFKYNGNRGIKVCDSWLNFENFYEDMGDRPEGYGLGRLDPDKGYSPDNCRWVPRRGSGKVKGEGARRITHNGETLGLPDWAIRTGISTRTLHTRLRRGWPVEKALTTPVRGRP